MRRKGLQKKRGVCPVCRDRGKIAVTMDEKRFFVPCATCENKPDKAWPCIALIGVITLIAYLFWGAR